MRENGRWQVIPAHGGVPHGARVLGQARESLRERKIAQIRRVRERERERESCLSRDSLSRERLSLACPRFNLV